MSRLNTLRTQFDSLKNGIEVIERAASEAGRDLTDAEQADVDALYERASAIKPEIEAEAAKVESLSTVSNILARVNPSTTVSRASAPAVDLTAGEFLASALKVQAGEITLDEHLSRAARYFDRAQQTTADNAGILPKEVAGNLISLYDASRPVWDSFTHPTMPVKGKVFTRPEITQHVATGDQASEFATVSSQKMLISGTDVTKFTEAGYLDISQQDLDWTDPSILDLVIADFSQVYVHRMEARASAFLVAQAATGGTATWTDTNIGTVISSVFEGAQEVWTDSKTAPDTLWLATDAFYELAAMTNSTTNVSGLTLLGDALNRGGTPVKIVHGPQLAAGTRILGSSKLVEAYENKDNFLRVAQPDVLGQRIAYYAYGAFFAKTAGLVTLEAA